MNKDTIIRMLKSDDLGLIMLAAQILIDQDIDIGEIELTTPGGALADAMWYVSYQYGWRIHESSTDILNHVKLKYERIRI